MTKLAARFLGLTFAVAAACWGLCLVCGWNGITFATMPLLRLPYLLGGWSPTIASFVALKRDGAVEGLGEWLKPVFALRQNWQGYGLVVLFTLAYILPQCLISGRGPEGAPLFLFPLFVVMMLLGGGLEEAGWRYVLQPELEKKLPFVPVVLVMALIWWLWHLPLFFIPGTGQVGSDYRLFGLTVLGLSFGLATLRRRTGSVWLCVLLHCAVNATIPVFAPGESLAGSLATAGCLMGLSFLVACFPKGK